MMKLFEKVKIGKERELKFLNIPIVQYGKLIDKNQAEQYFDFFPAKTFAQAVFDEIIPQIGNYKNILLNRHGMGETYILANVFKYLPLYKDRENLIVAGKRKYLNDIFELFCPEVKTKCVDVKEFHQILKNDEYTYKKRNFYVYLPLGHFDRFYKIVKENPSTNFYEEIVKKLNIKHKIEFREPNIDLKYEKTLFDKIKNKINLDNLIIISPHALSAEAYCEKFWKVLIKNFKTKGYSVFVNSPVASRYNSEQQNELYSVKDLYYIARHTKGLVGLRSGLLDVLSSVDIKQHVLYTQNPVRNFHPDIYIATHSLKKMPKAKQENIFEYDTFVDGPKAIIEKIMECY